MERLLKILGPLGLVLTLVGGVAYGILYSSGWAAILPLAVGLALVIVSAAVSLRRAGASGTLRSARLGLNTVVSVIALAAILIFAQTIVSRHTARYDTTSNKRFSLSPQTAKILHRLTKNVTLTCFFKEEAAQKTELEDLLAAYTGVSTRVKYLFIDPDKDPVRARRYKITNYGTIVIDCGSNEEKIMETSEEKITNAIAKVTREKKKTIYVLTGHGEKAIDDPQPSGLSELKQAVEGENYEIHELLTLRDTIPPDCALLMIPGPERDLFPQEESMIERYLAGGGKVLLLIDPLTEVPQIDSLLSGYGIVATNTVIVDRFGKLLAGNYLTPVVNKYGKHSITEGFRLASFFPQARALLVAKNKPSGVDAEVLASTGESAYAETNIKGILKGMTQYESDTDMKGPVDVGIVATKEVTNMPAVPAGEGNRARHSRVVTFGDSDFASNSYLNLSGNKDLIMNTIAWLAEEEDLIAVRAKNPVSQPVILTVKEGRVVFWLPVVGLPAIFAVIGVLVLIAKRRAS